MADQAAGTRVLVWQWGRRGGGPKFGVGLANGFRSLPRVITQLSMSSQAEILQGPDPPECELPVPTYTTPVGYVWRLITMLLRLGALSDRVAAFAPHLAVCAMPGPLDLVMAVAIRRAGGKLAVVVHDVDPHPGDRYPVQYRLQRHLCRQADYVAYLSEHVGQSLRAALPASIRLIKLSHPPLDFAVPKLQPHDGPMRLLFFGRLQSYKGLDLLALALEQLGPRPDLTVRVVGSGPTSPALEALERLPQVTVENRWVPEAEVQNLLGWADTVVLPYREATQSGVAAAALAAGRRVVATRVGGIAEQLSDAPQAILCDPTVLGLLEGLTRMLAEADIAVAATMPSMPRWSDIAATLLRETNNGTA